MRALTSEQLSTYVAQCPARAGNHSHRDNLPPLVTEDEGGSRVSFSEGTYQYHAVGADRNKPPSTSKWQGECFAQWTRIDPSRYLHSLSYKNPLATNLDTTNAPMDWYANTWNKVFRASIPALPTFSILKTRKVFVWKDLSNNSLMEASFYWRLMRAFRECLPFIHTAGVLHQRYPKAPPEVIFAQTILGQVHQHQGWYRKPMPANPNSTISAYGQIKAACSFLRNLMWAREMGRWDATKLIRKRGVVGPHHRRYWGHDDIWFGHTRNFQVNWVNTNEGEDAPSRLAANKLRGGPAHALAAYDRNRWSQSTAFMCPWWPASNGGAPQPNNRGPRNGWLACDWAHKILRECYTQATGVTRQKPVTLDFDSIFNDQFSKALWQSWVLAQHRRMY